MTEKKELHEDALTEHPPAFTLSPDPLPRFSWPLDPWGFNTLGGGLAAEHSMAAEAEARAKRMDAWAGRIAAAMVCRPRLGARNAAAEAWAVACELERQREKALTDYGKEG